MPVWAVFHPLRAKDTPDGPPRDRNVYNQPAPTTVPDDPRTVRYAREQARRIASVSRLAGIVLAGAVPTGYRGAYKENEEGGTWTGESPDRITDAPDVHATRWGYTPSHRRAFLRERGADPSDILPGERESIGEARSDDSFFGRDTVLASAWAQWKRDRCADLLRAVRGEIATLPVLLEGEAVFKSVFLRQGDRSKSNDCAVFFIPWQAETEPPLDDLFRGAWRELLPVPDATSGAILVIASDRTKSPASELVERSGRGKEHALTVVDWSHRTLEEVEALCDLEAHQVHKN